MRRIAWRGFEFESARSAVEPQALEPDLPA